MTINGIMLGPLRHHALQNRFDYDLYRKFDDEMIGHYKHLINFSKVTTDPYVYDTVLSLYDDQIPIVTIESLKIPFTWQGWFAGRELMRYWDYWNIVNNAFKPDESPIPVKRFFIRLMDIFRING
jgi:hypothetical protein